MLKFKLIRSWKHFFLVVTPICAISFVSCSVILRGRPKLTWVESVKRDLKDWNISKEIALDRSAWRLAINVPEP